MHEYMQMYAHMWAWQDTAMDGMESLYGVKVWNVMQDIAHIDVCQSVCKPTVANILMPLHENLSCPSMYGENK